MTGSEDTELARCQAELTLYKEAVREATLVCREAARGNLEPRVLRIHAEGDLGEMLHGINHLLDLTDAYVREAGACLAHAGAEQFYRQVLARGLLGCFRSGAGLLNAAMAQLAGKTSSLRRAEATVSNVVENVAAAATELHATAEALQATADQTSAQSSAVAAASQQAAENMDAVSLTTEQMVQQVGDIDRQVGESSSVARLAVGEADRTNAAVADLRDASHQVGQVVQLITKIANQTRLLALNATIEAARAGEFGKGFGVVATEVKGLAAQTAAATRQIGEQVTAIQTAVGTTVGALQTISSTISQINEISETTRAVVGEQRGAGRQMSASIREAAQHMREVSAAIASVSEASRETSMATGQVSAAAGELSRLAETLQAEMDQLFLTIRSPKASVSKPERPHRSTADMLSRSSA